MFPTLTTNVDVIAIQLLDIISQQFVGVSLRLWHYYFPEYEDPRN